MKVKNPLSSKGITTGKSIKWYLFPTKIHYIILHKPFEIPNRRVHQSIYYQHSFISPSVYGNECYPFGVYCGGKLKNSADTLYRIHLFIGADVPNNERCCPDLPYFGTRGWSDTYSLCFVLTANSNYCFCL